MTKRLPLLIGLVALGVVGADVQPLLAQSETPPAGSSRAFTPPIDQRGYHRHGFFFRHRARFHRYYRF